MAPSFLSKLVRQSPAPGESPRADSVSGGSSLSASTRSRTISTMGSQNTSRPSSRAGSSQGLAAPEVAVIPPSPSIPNPGAQNELPTPNRTRPKTPQNGTPLKNGNSNLSPAASPEPAEPSNLTTPQPGTPRSLGQSSSIGSLKSAANGTLESPAFLKQDPAETGQLRRSPSQRSNRSQTTPITTSHIRAATTPASLPSISNDSSIVSSPTSSTGLGLSESPEATRTEFGANINSSPNNNASTQGSTPASPSKRSRRSWRQGSLSNKRKPTGLAAAIAASGMAMANPIANHPHLNPSSMTTSSSLGSNQRSPTRSGGRRNVSGTSDNLNIPGHRHSYAHSAQPSMASSGGGGDDFDSSSEEGDDDSEGSEELDLDALTDDIPVAGYAVASSKRNTDFHELFSNIPEGDYLIEDYGCALQRDILVQGRLYISENHICFHANIFGWITDLSIPIYEIITLEKKMTAFVIPNAIGIATRTSKYTFASFLSRDTTYDVIYNIWRLSRPDDLESAAGSPRPSLDDPGQSGSERPDIIRSYSAAAGAAQTGPKNVVARKATQCGCGKKGEHYSETAMETVIPGTPDKIYNLMFTSGFIKEFMQVDQKLMDIQISDWSPMTDNLKLLARNMSYIKPLNGAIGPKQTKCEIRDETVHCDFDDYVSTVTTTRTPEVPSGGVFAVKTRTCLMWASPISTKILVTTQVEWTGRSFIKGIIERSCIEGQKGYHSELDRAMRTYIQEHRSEFIPAGFDTSAVPPEELMSPTIAEASTTEPKVLDDKTREKERNQRGLQWAWDTFEGAAGVAKQSTVGALELIKDAWDQSSSTTILIFIIVLLVLSNMWTLGMVGRREELGRRKEMKKTEEREKWVQGIVTALWDELSAGKVAGGQAASGLPPSTGNWRSDMEAMHKTLDSMEDRIRIIRDGLSSLD